MKMQPTLIFCIKKLNSAEESMNNIIHQNFKKKSIKGFFVKLFPPLRAPTFNIFDSNINYVLIFLELLGISIK